MKKEQVQTSIKTVDVIALEWFDKTNANSYFAGQIIINYGMKDERTHNMKYQYGYEDQYKFAALAILCDREGLISSGSLWRTCDDYHIVLRTTKHKNCKKSELKQY